MDILSHFKVTGDSLIDGVECTVLERTTYSLGGSSFQSEYFLHFDGDTLFWRYDSEFHPLLCFNAEIGDTWNPLPADNPGYDSTCTQSAMKVVAAYDVQFNGESFRQIEIATEIPYPLQWEDPWPSIVWGGTFNERTFGYGQFFPWYNSCNSVVEWECFGFRCYSDSELSLSETDGEDCDYPLFVSVPDRASGDIPELYPNPVRRGGGLRVENAHALRDIFIFRTTGELILAEKVNGSMQMKTNLTPGHYIVILENHNGEVSREKLIVLP
jgi:hypothetical protein